MIALVLAAVLASGPGASMRGGAAPVYSVLPAEFAASTSIGDVRATMRAPVDGTVTGLHWDVTASGLGLGSTFTVAVTADGTPICSAEIACTATGDGTVECDASFTSGQDIHVEITATSCLLNSGPAFLASATWRQ